MSFEDKSADKPIEHFCTLFNISFFSIGLTLYRSLIRHAKPFHLWILCIDETVEKYFRQLALPFVTLIPLHEVETAELRTVKSQRTVGEYCWTLTPFIFDMVFERDPSVTQVTYLDADLFFFADPRLLLKELKESHKHVLITEHAYDPIYEQSATSGRFCVQFLTFKATAEARAVLTWWQERCLEWCFARFEDGKFGDQKYLDSWPTTFGEQVHILQQIEQTLAPWNVQFFLKKKKTLYTPVFYHFHSLRFISTNCVKLYAGYYTGRNARPIYDTYVRELRMTRDVLKSAQIDMPYLPLPTQKYEFLRRLKRRAMGTEITITLNDRKYR